jgi:hypothetical protein
MSTVNVDVEMIGSLRKECTPEVRKSQMVVSNDADGVSLLRAGNGTMETRLRMGSIAVGKRISSRTQSVEFQIRNHHTSRVQE